MTPEEWKKFQNSPRREPSTSLLSVEDIGMQRDDEPFTVFYGYDVDRTTVHIYALPAERMFVVARYQPSRRKSANLVSIQAVADIKAQHMPTKRLNPERCNFLCCEIAENNGRYRMGMGLPFTTYFKQAYDPDTQVHGVRFDAIATAMIREMREKSARGTKETLG